MLHRGSGPVVTNGVSLLHTRQLWVRFSGIKFAMGLAYETHNPLPSHEIRRKRIRRQIFSTDAKKKIVRFQTAGIDTVSGHR